MKSLKRIFLVVLWNLATFHSSEGQDFADLFSDIPNLATNSKITVNATCGEQHAEHYCKLVEHVEISRQHCDVCDSYSDNPLQRHPITSAIDGSNQWWQSPTVTNGRQFNYITITMDLGLIYQVAYIIVKAANSPRPGNWILEKSLDGFEYTPWQYFAINSRECRKAYGIVARKGRPTYFRDDEVICTPFYSKLNPLEDGEIFVSLVNGRPGVLQPSKTLLEFTSARYVRFRFQKIRTLNADLMTFNLMDPQDVDPSVTRRYFYSIKDISIGGQCICYGHASRCSRLVNSDRLACNCEHNTCGTNCEECCPKFNQKPWQRGGNGLRGMCEECNCHGQAEVCVYNATVDQQGLSLDIHGNRRGGGVCMNCRGHTTGLNCEKCMEGYYRPTGISGSSSMPCRLCSCPLTLGSTGVCVLDDSRVSEGLNPGDCICRPGYDGSQCDQCSVGYFGYPNCRPCPCNAAGSVNIESCQQFCICKDNVEGLSCDKCKPGFYDLNIQNPKGCSPCFCFGITGVCQSAGLGIIKISDMRGDMDGWTVTTVNNGGFTLFPRLANGWLELRTYPSRYQNSLDHGWTIAQETIYYWQAPIKYQGNRLSSYGGNLRFRLRYTTDGTITRNYHIPAPNVILKGGNITITNGRDYFRENTENAECIPLLENNWYQLHSSGHYFDPKPIRKVEFMSVLNSVEGLLIRATHHTAQDMVYLDDVVLESVSAVSTSELTLPTVEKCACPLGYSGLSCESCDPGWRRVNNILYEGTCSPCLCNGHSKQCDPSTGRCLACSDNTFGDQCEQCRPGYFGDPTRGYDDDCKPCACPLTDPSNNFAASCQLSLSSSSYVCLNCQKGYTGSHCERCADGYYGNPMSRGGGCQPCYCGGNIDVSEPGSCNPYTGECLRCLHHTEGPECAKCQEGYFGTARNGDCNLCDCDMLGSLTNQCNVQTGQCQCRDRYGGRRCDQCEFDHWGLESGEGCMPCNCDTTGSRSRQCDSRTGQCPCKSGVTGVHCDRCQVGYYRFSQYGCQVCDACNRPGYVCDPLSGKCVCPPYTEGVSCERCVANAWGYSYEGCKPCDCNSQGSQSQKCNAHTGQCPCFPEYNGTHCGQCLFGMFNFPICQQCLCGVEGTDESSCDDHGNCYCANSGQCTCKSNVEGQKCTQCKTNSFSLSVDTPSGCTKCFCFKRSTTCSQALMKWAEVGVEDRSISFDNRAMGDIRRKGGLFTIPDNTSWATNPQEAAPTLSAPIYWTLPDHILGDMLLSYNGWITFSVTYLSEFWKRGNLPEGNGDSSSLLVITGNGFTLVHNDHTLYLPNKRLGFIVQLHENVWKLENGSPVTREMMMVVLQNVSDIFIRGTLDHFAYFMNLTDVHISVATPGNHANPALGVEDCSCPKQYTGLSCQNPAPGYYRVKPTGPIDLSGPSRAIGTVSQCDCNGHTNFCHPETGICEDCQNKTAGDNCELCVTGHYRDDVRSSASPCHPCACPLETNSFSSSCHSTVQGLVVCTNCLEGHTGDRCEQCDVGYYGQPLQFGGRCLPCACNPEGSWDTHCDLNGLCHCKPGITGPKCDECQPRHAVVGGVCISCDEGCTSWLMEDIDFLTKLISNVSINVVLPVPWERLFDIEEEANTLRAILYNNRLDKVKGLQDLSNFLKRMVDQHLPRSESLTERASEIEEQSEKLFSDAVDMEGKIQKKFDEIKNITRHLDKIVQDLVRNNETGLNMTDAIAQMTQILNEIESRDFSFDNGRVTMEKSLADDLLNRVQAMKDMLTNTSSIEKALNDSFDRILDLRQHAEKAKDNSNDVTFIVMEQKEKIEKLKGLIGQSDDLNKETEQKLSEGRNFIAGGLALLDQTDDNIRKIESDASILQYPMTELRYKERHLREEVPDAQILVQNAWEHARNLSSYADQLERMFEAARSASIDPLRAASVFDDIRRAVQEAEDAARKALEEAIKSRDIAGVDTLRKDVKQSLKRSIELMALANQTLRDRVEGFDETLKDLNAELDKVQDQEARVRHEVHVVEQDLHNLPTDISDRVSDVFHYVDAIEHNVTSTRDRVDDLLNRIKADMEKLRLFEENDTPGLIGSAAFYVNKVKKNVLNIKSNMTEIKDQIPTDVVDGNIRQLKQKILIAQEALNKLKPSMAANGKCFRSFASPSEPSRKNRVKFGFRTNSTENMLLLLIQTSITEFMAFELHNQKIRMTWAIGSLSGIQEHKTVIQLNNDLSATLYIVVAERFDDKATLDVYSSKTPPTNENTPVMDLSGTKIAVFNFNNDTNIFVAGSPSGFHLPVGLTVTNFSGCIGDLHIDDHLIGMNNFKLGTSASSCGGCKQITVSRGHSDNAYTFHGTGFSSLDYQREHYNSFDVKISFEFKTFWENGSILFTGNKDIGDFMAVQMVDGYLMFVYYLGGESLGILKSNVKYNTNTWYTVSIVKKGSTAAMFVDNVEVAQVKTPGSKTGLELERSPYNYFGGIPYIDLSRFVKIYPIELSSFVGWLKEFKVNSRSKQFGKGETLGVTEGYTAFKRAGFYGDGFLEMSTPSLMWSDFDISLSFVSGEDGLLFLVTDNSEGAATGSTENYFSMSIENGKLKARFPSQPEPLTMESQAQFNSHGLYLVTIKKSNRRLELLVNGMSSIVSRLPGGSSLNQVQGGKIFLGGVPAAFNIGVMAASPQSFNGCISNLFINKKAIHLSESTHFRRADVGRCEITQRAHTITLPPTTMPSTPKSCGATDYHIEPEAKTFGNTRESFVEIAVKSGDVSQRFNISFHFRTFFQDGMFFYLTSQDQNDFVATLMQNGKVTLSYDHSNLLSSVNSSRQIDDGLWHFVTVNKRDNRISLKVDDEAETSGVIKTTLNVEESMYMGGLPDGYNLKPGLIDHSFRGCMKNFGINGEVVRREDKAIISGLGNCYKNAVPGAYFSGESSGIIDMKFTIGMEIVLNLEFRTHKPDGILLWLSEPLGTPSMALELHEGKVKFSLKTIDVFTAETKNDDQYQYCDQKWHTVTASFIRNVVILSVDGGKNNYGKSEHVSAFINTSSPLYIGNKFKESNGAAFTDQGFEGCMRNVKIKDVSLDWFKLADSTDIHRTACPGV